MLRAALRGAARTGLRARPVTCGTRRAVRDAAWSVAFLLGVGSLLLTAGCATNRSALQSLTPADVRPSPAAPPVASRPSGSMTDPGPMTAESLARRNGLAYQDGGSYVLLSSADSRVRLYPGTAHVSIDGREVDLRAPTTRQGAAVMVPGPCVAYLESSIRRDAGHLARVRADASRVAFAGGLPPRPPAARAPSPARVSAPSLPARVGSSGEPGWEPVGVPMREWRWIVIHHSDDRSGNAAKYNAQHLSQGWENGLGYDFVIGNGTMSGDGQIEVGSRWLRQIQGAHTKTDDNCYNEHGIGICLVGDFEKGGRPTPAQMRALEHLCRWLMDRYGITLENVKGHSDCKPTACPGRHFPWAELRARIAGA